MRRDTQSVLLLLVGGTLLKVSIAGTYVRFVRAEVMDTLNMDFVRTARAKGAPERTVIRTHDPPATPGWADRSEPSSSSEHGVQAAADHGDERHAGDDADSAQQERRDRWKEIAFRSRIRANQLPPEV